MRFRNLHRVTPLALGLCLAAAGGANAGSPPSLTSGAPIPAPLGFLELCQRAPEDCTAEAAPSATDLVMLRRRAATAYWDSVFQTSTIAAPSAGAEARVADIDIEADGAPSAVDVAAPAVAVVEAVEPSPLSLGRDEWRRVRRLNARLNRAIRHRDDRDLFGKEDFWASPVNGVGDCEDYALAKRRALIQMGVPASVLSIALVRTPRGQSHAVLLMSTDRGEMVLDNLTPRVLRWNQTGYDWVARQAPGRPMDWISLGA